MEKQVPLQRSREKIIPREKTARNQKLKKKMSEEEGRKR